MPTSALRPGGLATAWNDPARAKNRADVDQVGMYDATQKGKLAGTGLNSFLSTLQSGGFGDFMGGSSGTGGGAGGGGFGGPGNQAQVPNVPGVDTSGAQAAIFARAKDQVGETAQGAMTGLRSAMGGRGMLGSGNEARQTARVIGQGQRQLGEVTREGAIQEAARVGEQGTTNYHGAITQRGQDLAANTAANQLQLQRTQLSQQSRQGLLQALGQSGIIGSLY